MFFIILTILTSLMNSSLYSKLKIEWFEALDQHCRTPSQVQIIYIYIILSSLQEHGFGWNGHTYTKKKLLKLVTGKHNFLLISNDNKSGQRWQLQNIFIIRLLAYQWDIPVFRHLSLTWYDDAGGLWRGFDASWRWGPGTDWWYGVILDKKERNNTLTINPLITRSMFIYWTLIVLMKFDTLQNNPHPCWCSGNFKWPT